MTLKSFKREVYFELKLAILVAIICFIVLICLGIYEGNLRILESIGRLP